MRSEGERTNIGVRGSLDGRCRGRATEGLNKVLSWVLERPKSGKNAGNVEDGRTMHELNVWLLAASEYQYLCDRVSSAARLTRWFVMGLTTV